jgi:GNAT superfamily N-acetyltransferase
MMQDIFIREAKVDDLSQILALLAQPDMSPDDQIPEAEARPIFERMIKTSDHHIYVAVSGDEVVGTFALITISHLSHHGARSAVIEDVVVKTEWQGHGVGRKLMTFAAEQARIFDCYKLVLSSGMKRNRAHEFYESLGFERHGYSFLLNLG